MKKQVSREEMVNIGLNALDIFIGIIDAIPIYQRDKHSSKLVLGSSMTNQDLYHVIKEMKKIIKTIDSYEIAEYEDEVEKHVLH